MECWIKTSGKTGLHVLASWSKGKGDYEKAREWALEVAADVVETLPDIATIERRKSARNGRLYLDVMQNARGHHAVPPYVLRAIPEALVSTPIRWSELNNTLTPERFNIRTVLRRIARQHHDPMAPLLG